MAPTESFEQREMRITKVGCKLLWVYTYYVNYTMCVIIVLLVKYFKIATSKK